MCDTYVKESFLTAIPQSSRTRRLLQSVVSVDCYKNLEIKNIK